MKTLIYKSLLLCMALSVLLFSGCEKDQSSKEKKQETDLSTLAGVCAGNDDIKPVNTGAQSQVVMSDAVASTLPYTVTLLFRKSNGDGTYTWVWSVSNPNPGNGKDGTTVQDLSHWAISIGSCATLKDIVSAATSTDGTTWKSFVPNYKADKSQNCYTKPILKFDLGTKGTQKSYYRLIVSKNFVMEKQVALYKSGVNTGCGTFKICGIGACPE